ncbi:MAG: flavodoxin [Candidatus Howiella sp.]|jgi:flavodoxin
MKKIISFLTVCIMIFPLSACGNNMQSTEPSDVSETGSSSDVSDESQPSETDISKPKETDGKTLVIYFSCTGNTKKAAEEIQRLTNADTFEIIPKVPYTSEDLNYSDDDSRANREMRDDTARPEIDGTLDNLADYDTVFIGYPLWWGTMPKIINTLLDTYDFSDKTIIPFCTSGSSSISTSVSAIKALEPNANVLSGFRVSDISKVEAQIADVISQG